MTKKNKRSGKPFNFKVFVITKIKLYSLKPLAGLFRVKNNIFLPLWADTKKKHTKQNFILE